MKMIVNTGKPRMNSTTNSHSSQNNNYKITVISMFSRYKLIILVERIYILLLITTNRKSKYLVHRTYLIEEHRNKKE